MHSREKIECPRCHKHKTTHCFIYNKVLKIKICRLCNRIIGNNKFYIPFKNKGSRIIGRYSITDREKNELHRQFMCQGLDSSQAWRRVNQHISLLRRIWWKQHWNKNIQPKEEITKQEFLEGLKIDSSK
jgi:hypothetical protein